jgi:hypothetical protein
MASVFDPRDKALLAWLALLLPRQELIARLAVRGLCDRCRDDRAWRARVDELMPRFGNKAAKIGVLLREAERLERDLVTSLLGGER